MVIKKNTKAKPNVKEECKWWGIGLIIAGIIPFIFPEILDVATGVIVLILGIITLIFRQRWNLALIGVLIILIGVVNIIGTLIVQEQYEFLFLGIIQLLIGIDALNKYHKLEKKGIIKG